MVWTLRAARRSREKDDPSRDLRAPSLSCRMTGGCARSRPCPAPQIPSRERLGLSGNVDAPHTPKALGKDPERLLFRVCGERAQPQLEGPGARDARRTPSRAGRRLRPVSAPGAASRGTRGLSAWLSRCPRRTAGSATCARVSPEVAASSPVPLRGRNPSAGPVAVFANQKSANRPNFT